MEAEDAANIQQRTDSAYNKEFLPKMSTVPRWCALALRAKFLTPARPQDLTCTAHLLVPTDICPTFFFLRLFFPTISTRAKGPMDIVSTKETETTPQALRTARINSTGPDYLHQFVRNPQPTPAQIDHGGTCRMADCYLSLIIILKSPPREHKPHLRNNTGIGRFPQGACVTLCQRLPFLTSHPNRK